MSTRPAGAGGWLKSGAAAGSPAPLSSPVVRRSNAFRVLKILQRLGVASRIELARQSGLTSTTAYRLVDHLSSLGLIVPAEIELTRQGAGRRPVSYQFNRGLATVAAVDVGNETTRLALGDATGAIVARDHAPTAQLADSLVESLAGWIRRLARRVPNLGGLLGISAGIAAIVDRDSGIVVRASQHGEWDGLLLRDELTRALGCPASLAQDDHLAALAEVSGSGSAPGRETVVVIHQGKGVGAGFIVNGRPYVGAHGAAGRLERWTVPGHDRPASLGEVLTADALVRAYHDLGGAPTIADGAALCAAARSGDAAALEVVGLLAGHLGRTFLQLAVAFDPEVMIFGGGFAGSYDLFEPEIRRSLSALPRPPELLVSRLGDQAVVLGALQAGLEHVDRHIAEVLEAA